MWLLLFVILLLVIFGKLLSFALKAAWSITKILFSVVIFPLVLIMLVVAGLMYVALPVLVIAGIVGTAGRICEKCERIRKWKWRIKIRRR